MFHTVYPPHNCLKALFFFLHDKITAENTLRLFLFFFLSFWQCYTNLKAKSLLFFSLQLVESKKKAAVSFFFFEKVSSVVNKSNQLIEE